MEHSDVNVKLMHPKAPAKMFFWPDHEDICWIPLNHMICRVKPPSSGSTARYYSFDETGIDQVLGYLQTSYIFFFICFFCTFNYYILFDYRFYPVLKIQINFFVLLFFNVMSSLAKTDFVKS